MVFLLQREAEAGCKFVVPKPICTYWDVENGTWDTRGCQHVRGAGDSSESVTCICNHLTSFGIIFDWQGAADPQEPGKYVFAFKITSYN
jgi:GPCR proteolysis site, GPS, motif